jgi:hypothetical protein
MQASQQAQILPVILEGSAPGRLIGTAPYGYECAGREKRTRRQEFFFARVRGDGPDPEAGPIIDRRRPGCNRVAKGS